MSIIISFSFARPPVNPEPMKRQKNLVNGWLNLWKPAGISSMQAVAKARWLYNAAKAGHAGTLDPAADGILPIAFGEATKLIPLLHESAKAYRFTVRWGEQTNTDDTEGEIVATSPNRPTAEAIHAALPRFTGVINQIPPAFSAVKINGVRSYAAARAGETVVLAARPVHIARFDLVNIIDAQTAVFEVECGTGTYVRALARDLAEVLGTKAHCLAITRVFVGKFSEDTAILLANLEEMPYESRGSLLWPIAKGLDDIPALAVTDTEAQRLRRGNEVSFISKMDYARLPKLNPEEVLLAMHGETIVAICSLDGATLKPNRVLNT
jgi:tRNA pseudouridine55 synthase